MSLSIIIGIDNGLSGALVAVDKNLKLLGYRDTPVVTMTKTKKGKKSNNKEFAPAAMKDALASLIIEAKGTLNADSAFIKVWLEVAHAMPEQGLSSTFKTGRGAGLWEGIVVGLGLAYDVVHAKTWTKALLKDVPVGDPKQRSMMKAQRLFGSDLPLIKPGGRVLSMDGRADAALIACYGVTQQCDNLNQVINIRKTPIKKKVSCD